MGIGKKAITKTATRTVKDEIGEKADELVDKGPVDRLEDKVDDATDKIVRGTVKKAIR